MDYNFIVEKGYDDKLGVRPIERFIEAHISRVVAREILFGRLEHGGEIKICVKDNKLDIDFIVSYDADSKTKQSETSNDLDVTDVIVKKKPVKKVSKPKTN